MGYKAYYGNAKVRMPAIALFITSEGQMTNRIMAQNIATCIKLEVSRSRHVSNSSNPTIPNEKDFSWRRDR